MQGRVGESGSERVRPEIALYEGNARLSKPRGEASKYEAAVSEWRVKRTRSEVKPAYFEVESSDFGVESSNLKAEALKFKVPRAFSRAESLQAKGDASVRQAIPVKHDVSSLRRQVRRKIRMAFRQIPSQMS